MLFQFIPLKKGCRLTSSAPFIPSRKSCYNHVLPASQISLLKMSLASFEIGGESGILKFVFQLVIFEHVSAGFSDKNGGYPIFINITIRSSHKE